MSDWQPIETAPKELEGIMDFILVWDGRSVRPASFEDGRWIDEANHNGYDHAELDPTHWMPLPDPPSE